MTFTADERAALDSLPEQYREKAERTLQSLKENKSIAPVIDTLAMQSYLEMFLNAFFTAMGPELKEDSRLFCLDLVAACRVTQEKRNASNGALMSAVVGLALATVSKYNSQLAARYAADEATQ